jgi:hypothetical protein
MSLPPASTLSSRSTLKPHFSRTRIEPALCLGNVRVEGPLGHEVQENGERPGRDTLPPMFLADPVADQADAVLTPAADVARNLVVEEDRLDDCRRVAEDVGRPMGVERCAIPGGEGGHARGVAVELLLVEDREVVGLDIAESYFVAHFSIPGRVCRSSLSVLFSWREGTFSMKLRVLPRQRKRPAVWPPAWQDLQASILAQVCSRST